MIILLYKSTYYRGEIVSTSSSYLFFPLPTSLLYFSFVPPLHFYLYFWSQVHIPLNWNCHYPCCSKSDTMTTEQWSSADTCLRSFLWQLTGEASGTACICKYTKLDRKNQSRLSMLKNHKHSKGVTCYISVLYACLKPVKWA